MKRPMIVLPQVEDLKAALELGRKAVADIHDNCPYFFPEQYGQTWTPERKAWLRKVERVSKQLRAALAAANGKES